MNEFLVDDGMELDPVANGPALPTPVKTDYKSKDMELYNQWAKTRSKKDMSKLIRHLQPLISRQVINVSGTLPVAALEGEARDWAIKGVKTFDPSRGFALGTHITNYVQRVKRLNYKYQNAARLPEDMHLDFHKYNRALEQLRDETNEEPEVEAIANRLGWSKNQVTRFKNRIFTEGIESLEENPTQVSKYSDDNILMGHLLSHLTEDEKIILKHKGTISATELAAKLGVNTNRLNYLQSNLKKKILGLKQELGL